MSVSATQPHTACKTRREGVGPEADSELQLYSVSWAAHRLNHITANLGLCQSKQETQRLLSLPAASPMPDIWATDPLQCCSPPGKMSGPWDLSPAQVGYWRLGVQPHLFQAGAFLSYRFLPTFPLGQILLDTSGRQPCTVTSLSRPLGFLNFNVRNDVFAKNNILIRCPPEPNPNGAVTLQKKRRESQDLEFKVG